MNKPIEKMIVEPYGEDYMAGAWVSLFTFACKNPEHMAAFEAETGLSISNVLTATGLAAAIDEATGRQEDVIAKFAYWVTVNLWGQKEESQA